MMYSSSEAIDAVGVSLLDATCKPRWAVTVAQAEQQTTRRDVKVAWSAYRGVHCGKMVAN